MFIESNKATPNELDPAFLEECAQDEYFFYIG